MTWSDTGRAWVPPSPNLRTPEAAIAYPGTALVEGTNVSEGRGTDAPFLLIGAPWLKPELLVPVVKVPGFTVEPTTFTPAASPAAPSPKHAGKASPGLRVKVTDAAGGEALHVRGHAASCVADPARVRVAARRRSNRPPGGNEEAARRPGARRRRGRDRGRRRRRDRGLSQGPPEGAAVLASSAGCAKSIPVPERV